MRQAIDSALLAIYMNFEAGTCSEDSPNCCCSCTAAAAPSLAARMVDTILSRSRIAISKPSTMCCRFCAFLRLNLQH